MKSKNSRSPLVKTGYNAPVTEVVVAPLPTVNEVSRRFWEMWVLVLMIAFFVQLLTLDVLPHIQQDEVQITDYGRLALDPKSDWSISWWIAEDKPLLLWTYLGPLIAEVSFQMGGPSGLGPRVASLIGGLFAATMALGWLLARRVPVYAAFGISVAFMLDPLFVLSQRMARSDSWAIALCLACCWFLREATIKKSNAMGSWRIMAAGGFAAAATLIWPSAVLLYPLIVLELLHGVKSKKAFAYQARYFFSRALYFGLGGLLTAVLLLLPIWQNLLIIFSDSATMVTQNVDSSKTVLDRLFALFHFQHWETLLRIFRQNFSFFFPLLAFVGALLHREKGLVLVFILTISIIFASLVYPLRVLYLYPYMLALSSGIFIQAAKNPSSWLKKLSWGALGVLLLWSVGTSLVIRTALGLEAKTERDRDKIYQVASSTIGAGNHHVFLGFTYEFYFAGRSLGWKLYTPYIQYTFDDKITWTRENQYKPTDKFLELLAKMDYAIFSEGTVTKELAAQMAGSGLYYARAFRVGEEHYQNKTKNFLNWLLQGKGLWFLQGKDSYGFYVLYKRQKPGSREDPLTPR